MNENKPETFCQIESFSQATQNVVQYGFGTRVLSDDLSKWSQALAVEPQQLITLKQIHSNRVVVVDDQFDVKAVREADALVTNRTDVVLAVKSADCLPVLLFDPVKKVVAAVHAGWRGLAQQVVIETVEVMNHRFGVDVRDLHVAFGPCLQVTRFEVGDDVIEAFRQALGHYFSYESLESGKWLIDMPCTAAMGLEQLGLHAKNFYFAEQDTFTMPEVFHSYRRDAKNAGRQLNFIRLVS